MKINRFVIDNEDNTEFEITGTVNEEEAKEIVKALRKYVNGYGQCANCGCPHNIGLCADCGVNHPPSPDALTVCSRCGRLHQFDKDLTIRPIDMPKDIRPEVKAMILAAQKQIKERYS